MSDRPEIFKPQKISEILSDTEKDITQYLAFDCFPGPPRVFWC